MRPSIATAQYYTDFEKVIRNVENVKVELNILNSLIGSKNIEHDYDLLVEKYPSVTSVIPILVAVRAGEIPLCDGNADLKKFMRDVGLFNLIQNHLVNNLVDYVYGVEVGLDSNGRKGRGGMLMENLVESYLVKAGVKYEKQARALDIDKVFDFIVYGNKYVYGIETNFYTNTGSKPSEVCRAYEMIAKTVVKGFKFVWVTDGINCWSKTQKPLRRVYDVLENLYNIKDLEEEVFEKLFV